MSTESPRSGPKRPWLQFRVRTLLLLTLLSAVGVSWFTRREWEERTIANTRARVREHYVRLVDPKTQQSRKVLDGAWTLSDRYGIVRVAGRFQNDLPDGDWTFYDADGRRLLAGKCLRGQRDGVWTAWYPDGTKRAEAHYELIWLVKPTSGPKARPAESAATRAGKMILWWASGDKQAEGAFIQNPAPIEVKDLEKVGLPPEPQPSLVPRSWGGGSFGGFGPWLVGTRVDSSLCDVPDGEWTFFDEQGQTLAHGNFRRARRDGEWSFWNAPDQAPRTVYYAAGRAVVSLDAELARWNTQLGADTFRERHRAMWELVRLGDAAEPALSETAEVEDAELRLMAVGALQQLSTRLPSPRPRASMGTP